MNILIVEDQEDWRDLYCDLFNEPGIHITALDNVPEALQVIKHGDQTFDLAIADKGGSGRWSGQPDIIGHRDGLQVLELLKELQPACLRVLATAEPYERGAFDKFNVDIFFDKRVGDVEALTNTTIKWYDEGHYRKTKPILLDGHSGGSPEILR